MAFEDVLRQLIDTRAARLQAELTGVSAEIHAEFERAIEQQKAALARDVDERIAAGITAATADVDERIAEAVARATEEAEVRLASELSQLRADHERAFAQEQQGHARTLEEERASRDQALAELRAEHERTLDKLRAAQEQALADERAARDRAVAEARAGEADAVAAARATALSEAQQSLTDTRGEERHAQLASTERLLNGVRRIDQGQSLSDVLAALADASAAETRRVAVLVAGGAGARGWRLSGFEGSADAIDLPLAEAGIVGEAMLRHESCFTTRHDHERRGALAPAFAGLTPEHVGLAVPILVGGDAVAVVYADDMTDSNPPVPASWPEAIEILGRHAAARLETLTARRTAQALGIPIPSGKPAGAGSSRGAAAPAGAEDESARRYARLLVSEIKLYNEGAVRVGRQKRDLLERLRFEIDRARRLYDERVSSGVRARAYFEEELVQTLADGDPALLGPAVV